MIYQHPHISLSAVGQASIMDKSRVTRSVESLVSSGLIVRETNTEDKRASVLDLTPEGHEIYAKVSKLAMRVQRRFLNSLTAEELKFFDIILSCVMHTPRA